MPANSSRQSGVAAFGILGGVLGLGLLVLLAVGLPRLTEPGAIELPETLPAGLVAADTPDGLRLIAGEQGDEKEVATMISERVAYAEELLGETFETDVAVRVYVGEDNGSQVNLVAVDGPRGYFVSGGLPIDAAELGLQRAPLEVVREGEAICAVRWQTTETGDTELPQSLVCQQESGGRTIQLEGAGLSVAQAAEVLDSLV